MVVKMCKMPEYSGTVLIVMAFDRFAMSKMPDCIGKVLIIEASFTLTKGIIFKPTGKELIFNR
jgi:hypothetical protein